MPSYGPNLFLPSAGLLSHWLIHATRELDTEAEGCEWKFRQAYCDTKYKKHAIKLSKEDRDDLTRAEQAPYFSITNDQSMLLCFTTSTSYDRQVEKELSTHYAAEYRGRKLVHNERWERWPIGWDRIMIDEVHREHNESSGTISRLRRINGDMQDRIP